MIRPQFHRLLSSAIEKPGRTLQSISFDRAELHLTAQLHQVMPSFICPNSTMRSPSASSSHALVPFTLSKFRPQLILQLTSPTTIFQPHFETKPSINRASSFGRVHYTWLPLSAPRLLQPSHRNSKRRLQITGHQLQRPIRSLPYTWPLKPLHIAPNPAEIFNSPKQKFNNL